MKYAPIAIKTLDRYDCLEKCINSLKNNAWSEHTELYISVDYPPEDKYIYGYNKVLEYLNEKITGFKQVYIYYQEKNLGALENSIWLMDKVFEKHDCIISLEDDNELAPGFIQFCDKGLEIFENDPDIIAINASDYVYCENGYTPEVRNVSSDCNNIEKRQLLYHACAFWKKKRYKMKEFCETNAILEIRKKPKMMIKLYKKSKSFFYQYIHRVCTSKQYLPWYNGKIYAIDFVWDIYMLVYDKYVVSPIVPLMRDHGVRGNGVNYTSTFENALELETRQWECSADFEYIMKEPIVINDYELKNYDININLSPLTRVKLLLKYLWTLI